jgi:hypothetical protein
LTQPLRNHVKLLQSQSNRIKDKIND